MAKQKKTEGKRKTRSSSQSPPPERMTRSITESAQQIWLAGMGAFNRAQAEGSKLFEGLVRDGLSLEQTARAFAGKRAIEVRDAVEDQVGHARERASDTWDKLEKVFEERLQRALVGLGVPGREDFDALTRRVDRLTAELRKANAAAAQAPQQAPKRRATASAAPAPAAKKAAPAKKAASNSAAKKPVAAKAVRKPAPAASGNIA